MKRLRLVYSVFFCAATTLSGAEFQVNTRSSGAQRNAAIAMRATGESTVVWSSYFSSSGRSNDILGRRFDPNGLPLDLGEFQINTTVEGNQAEPTVALDSEGRFLVVWQGPGLDEEDIFARLFDPDGLPLTDEILVNTDTAGPQRYPRVTATSNETFVVVWECRGPENEAYAVRGQLLNGQGLPIGPQLWIDEDIYDCRYPDVAADASGRFAVTWVQDRSNNAVLARLFDPNAVALTEAVAINAESISSITQPSISMDGSGRALVAWDGDPRRASDDEIQARWLGADGQPEGDPFLVSLPGGEAEQWPQAAVNDANEFVVVWQADSNDPDCATDIVALQFDASGAPMGEPTLLNTFIAGKQRYPDVALKSDGLFISVWESDAQDTSGYGIFARITSAAAAENETESN
jgi:hypothetical protein